MFYGQEGADGDGLSDLAAFEMGQMGQLGAGEAATGQQWAPQDLQKIGQNVQDLAKVYAESIQTQAIAKYGPKLPGQQGQLPPGFPGGQVPGGQPPWLKPAMIVGGLALGGLALWYFMKKRKTSSNPSDGWHTIGD
jgi:hypothetical protein